MRKQLVLTTSLLLAACTSASAEGPASAAIEKSVLASADSVSNHRIKVSAFKKQDGMLQQNGTYVADFIAQVEFTECGMWKPGGNFAFRKEGFRSMSFRLAAPFEGCAADGTLGPWIEFVIAHKVGKGFKALLNGQAIFVKKESGWQMSEVWLFVPRGT